MQTSGEDFFSELTRRVSLRAGRSASDFPKAQIMETQAGLDRRSSATGSRKRCSRPGATRAEEIAERFDSLFATAVARVLTGTDVVSLKRRHRFTPILRPTGRSLTSR